MVKNVSFISPKKQPRIYGPKKNHHNLNNENLYAQQLLRVHKKKK